MSVLELRQVCKYFGGLAALEKLDLSVEEGELVGLIGPNGAGKTTVFNLITGLYRPTSGEIKFYGRNLIGLAPHQITALGIARTFQNIRLFSEMTVLNNVKIGMHWHSRYGVATSILRLPTWSRKEKEIAEKSEELLSIFGLISKKDELAKNLPYGQQRRLEIARALACRPKLLLLDEPAAGMNPQETQELVKLIRWLRDEFNLTILLIEHDMSLVMGVCQRIYVLDYGRRIAVGTPEEVRTDPRVIQAYLGEEEENGQWPHAAN
ncbi:MAG: ABC transporter ATP-binding protein [Clostridia bacterium]|nr:ABC transporter ATP-binding protein [Clostridia bacterium]